MIERILQDFDQAHGIRSISLRYFNAAGADPDAEIGEAHHPETHLIPLVLDVANGLLPYINIFGNDYETPDGTCIRDYIHVSDLANAHILALQALENGAITTAYNLGNGQGYSVNEVILMAGEVTKKNIQVEITSRRIGDPARLVGDATRAKVELMWQPKFDKLQNLIETAWNWHCKYKSKSK
jgi:UDP-glucose-4-epimerase GalE